VVGIVGRLVPVKNHDLLLSAQPRLEEMLGRPVRILVVGGGSRAAMLRELTRELGTEDRVSWLGWRSDLPDLYPAMDCLALTSVDEGTPVAVVEALAAGTPVAARAVGGVPEVLDRVELARLIPEGTVDSVASTLSEVLRLQVSHEVRDRVRRDTGARFATDRLARDMEALYREELRAAGAG